MNKESNIHKLLLAIFRRRNRPYLLAGFGAVFALCLFYIISGSLAPGDFPQQKEIVTIKPGTYLSQAADIFAQNHIIRSAFLFKVYVVLISGHRQVQAGDYLFDAPLSALKVAYRGVSGIEGLPKIKITFVEGMTVKDMAAILDKNIPDFDAKTFLVLATPLEGSLFPDTYYFYQNNTPQQIVDQLHNTFIDKIRPLLLSFQMSGKTLTDVITMASIVEREATSTTDRKMIAGILWKRIDAGMPLQVDPPFYYILGKDSAHLTVKDLAMDSPYNTYKHKGLPPTAIDNPSLDAIDATLNPTSSKYWFYLSGKNGTMHYGVTLNDHVNNQKFME